MDYCRQRAIRALATSSAALFCALNAGAATWVDTATSSVGEVYQLDYDRVEPFGRYVRAWVRADASATKPKQPYHSSMKRYEVDCKEQTFRMLASVTYDANGQVLSQNTYQSSTPHQAVVPESVMELIADGICFTAELKKQK